jgi:hypothetical protein
LISFHVADIAPDHEFSGLLRTMYGPFPEAELVL